MIHIDILNMMTESFEFVFHCLIILDRITDLKENSFTLIASDISSTIELNFMMIRMFDGHVRRSTLQLQVIPTLT
jgi:hypothetical protein